MVIYDYIDDQQKRKQKWKSFEDKHEAQKYKAEIEYKKAHNRLINPTRETAASFLRSWAALYGKAKWSYSMYTTSMALIENHIIPEIGDIPIQELTPLHIEHLYDKLRTKRCAGAKSHGREEDKIPFLSSTTIRHVHTLLKTAFDKAVEWKRLDQSPVVCDAPKKSKTEKNIWTPEMVRSALDDIEHEQLHLAIHLAFICSLRNGEAMALTWDDVDFDNLCIHIRKTLQRATRDAINLIPKDDLMFQFPPHVAGDKKSILVLKKTKTSSSERMVYMTPELRHELLMHKAQLAKEKAYRGKDYKDFNLVFAQEDGFPIEPKLCEKWFKKWQKRTDLDLPPIIFHELRHSSASYKLIESQGDVKLVQGDLGHASAETSINTYAQVQDPRRREFIQRLGKEFYHTQSEAQQPVETKDFDGVLSAVLENPKLKEKLLAALLEKKDF